LIADPLDVVPLGSSPRSVIVMGNAPEAGLSDLAPSALAIDRMLARTVRMMTLGTQRRGGIGTSVRIRESRTARVSSG
jgi:hypothetical protein